MHANQKLSTHSRILIGWLLIITLALMLAMPFESSFAKRPKKEPTSPVNGSVPGDTSAAYDTTLPSLEEFVAVQVEPTMFHMVSPVYPKELKNQTVIGTVWIRAGVDMRGVVRDAKVGRSSGNQALDDAALAAARKCTFNPAIENGKPVAAWINYLADFASKHNYGGKESTFATQIRGGADTTLPGPTDSVAVDSMPEMTFNAQPVYPKIAVTAGLTGTVLIKALIDRSGEIRAVVVQKSSGSMALDDSAVGAGWATQFTPAKKDGQPVAVWITYKVDFKLSDK